MKFLEYLKASRLDHTDVNGIGRRVGRFFSNWEAIRDFGTSSKDYGLGFVELSAPSKCSVSLSDTIQARRSVMPSDKLPITSSREVSELGEVLSSALGIREKRDVKFDQAILQKFSRSYPSAGGLFCIESYLLCAKVIGEDAGSLLYYNWIDNTLMKSGRRLQDFDTLFEGTGHRFDLETGPSAVVVLTARWETVYQKYGERSLRFAFLEAGHMMQNMCLFMSAKGIPFTPVGGFDEILLTEAMGLLPSSEDAIYCGVIW